MCKHAPGAFCPFRHQMEEQMEEKRGAVVTAHSHCLFHKASKDAIGFTKAPCASDTPKTIMPQYVKDFLLPSDESHFTLSSQGMAPPSSFDALALFTGRGIEHPPRIF